ncbi:MAG: GIY-YIG nuclease family protein [Bacteroidota bacterium]
MIMIYVYVLQSTQHQFRYVGMTNDLETRLQQHNRGSTSSTKFYRPFVVVHTEAFPDRQAARKREKYLKSAAGRRWLSSMLDNQE